MKQKVIISAAMAAMILLPTALRAQDLSSGYFVEDYTYRYQMNPAFGNSQNFISMPALGNLNVGLHGNLGISDVLYNVDGKTTTFMNPKLSSDEVLKNINDVNRIGTLDKIGILSAGFKAFGGYNTVSINAVADVSVKVPGEMFNLLKNGVANKTYDLGDLLASGVAYGEIAFGHSRQVMKGLRVGATLKFMLGGGYMDAHMRNANLVLGENEWTVTTDADLRSSVKGLTYKTKVNDRTGHRYVNGIDVDGTGLNGFGMALDLGAVYETPVKGLTVSLALLDLGFISWNNDMLATTNGEKTFTTDKYTFNADDDAPNSFSKEWDRLRDDFSAIYELDDMGDQGGCTSMPHATLNIGVQYALPMYNKLTFGLLNTTRLAGDFTTTDFRLSANIAPCRIFSGGVNLGVGTFGASFGWVANLHLTGFNFFLGMDRVPGKLCKQGVPLSSNAQVTMGINFPF